MPVSVVASGTLTATTTSSTLTSTTVAGAYELHVDMNALTSAHTVQTRLTEAVLSGGTARALAYAQTTGSTGGSTPEPIIKVIGPVGADTGVTATFIITAGTSGIDFPWKLLRI